MTKIFGNQIYFAKPISAYLCLTIVFISYNNRGTLYKVQPNILEKTIKGITGTGTVSTKNGYRVC